ncbi:MAG: Holliday junction resolvase RuvX [Cyanobacteria bacterium SIG27]|nr:Holliday junction resolvase RuvX [Cyanobacteria bacterium SIG27]
MELRKRILALDIGTKRIGVAISDVFWMGATPIKTISRKDDKTALGEIEKICREYNTNTILIGIPYNMDGTLGFQAKNCLNFIKPLRNNYEILEQDERLSSSQAEEILKQQGKKYTKNKGMVDVTAACVILTEYLDNNR